MRNALVFIKPQNFSWLIPFNIVGIVPGMNSSSSSLEVKWHDTLQAHILDEVLLGQNLPLCSSNFLTSYQKIRGKGFLKLRHWAYLDLLVDFVLFCHERCLLSINQSGIVTSWPLRRLYKLLHYILIQSLLIPKTDRCTFTCTLIDLTCTYFLCNIQSSSKRIIKRIML